jgi:hypothetical protein
MFWMAENMQMNATFWLLGPLEKNSRPQLSQALKKRCELSMKASEHTAEGKNILKWWLQEKSPDGRMQRRLICQSQTIPNIAI